MWPYRAASWIVLFLFALLIQTSILPLMFPPGYVPSLVLPVVVLIAGYENPQRGLLVGAIGGLMMDMWAGRAWGLNTFPYALVGYGVAVIQSKIVRDQVFVPGLLAGLAVVFLLPVQWVLLLIGGYHFHWVTYAQPLPSSVLFSMLMTPALGGILGLRSRYDVQTRYGSYF